MKPLEKCLIVIPSYAPDFRNGGSVTGCKSFANLLGKNGTSVDIATLNTLDDEVHQRFIENANVFYFKRYKFWDFLASGGWGLSLEIISFIYSQRKHYDVIYFRSLWNFASLAGIFVCYLFGAKFAISASGKFQKTALEKSYWIKAFVIKILALPLKNISFVHFSSSDEYESCMLRNLKKLPTLICEQPLSENIVDLYEVKNKQPHSSTKINFFTCSRIAPIKRIEGVLELYVRICDKRQSNLHIFGEFQNELYKRKILELCHELELNVKFGENVNDVEDTNCAVIFYGFKSLTKIIRNLPQDAIFLQNSESEGFSNSLLENLSLNYRCIVSEGCGFSDYIDELNMLQLPALGRDSTDSVIEYLDRNPFVENRDIILNRLSHAALSCKLQKQLMELT